MPENNERRVDVIYNQELPTIKREQSKYDSSGNYVEKNVLEVKAHTIEKAKKVFDDINKKE